MSEVRLEVKVFQIRKICVECGEGQMLPTGSAIMTNPARYQHKCDNCDHFATYFQCYPRFEYEEIPAGDQQ